MLGQSSSGHPCDGFFGVAPPGKLRSAFPDAPGCGFRRDRLSRCRQGGFRPPERGAFPATLSWSERWSVSPGRACPPGLAPSDAAGALVSVEQVLDLPVERLGGVALHPVERAHGRGGLIVACSRSASPAVVLALSPACGRADVHRPAVAQVGYPEGPVAVAAQRRAEQREYGLVLVYRQELAVANRPTLRG